MRGPHVIASGMADRQSLPRLPRIVPRRWRLPTGVRRPQALAAGDPPEAPERQDPVRWPVWISRVWLTEAMRSSASRSAAAAVVVPSASARSNTRSSVS